MMTRLRTPTRLAALAIAVGLAAGLVAARNRLAVEDRNREVEMALEWPEVLQLAEASRTNVDTVLREMKGANLTTLAVAEDTVATLEASAAVRIERVAVAGGYGTLVTVDNAQTLARIHQAVVNHQISGNPPPNRSLLPGPGGTTFILPTHTSGAQPGRSAYAEAASGRAAGYVRAALGFSLLRNLGVGLPAEAVMAARRNHLLILGRIGNFPGANLITCRAVLKQLQRQGASKVIFVGDEVLGYRGLETQVAAMLRPAGAPTPAGIATVINPTGLLYGAVEFGKQRGDERLQAALHGDYVRVHTIQAAELGQMSPDEAADRFILAARERNIRLCIVRLPSFSGPDPLMDSALFFDKIARGISAGNAFTGGGYVFGPAHRYAQPRVPGELFLLLGLGAGAGAAWMLFLLLPLTDRQAFITLASCMVCGALLGAMPGDGGRKLAALAAGIAFPTIACLLTFPSGPAVTGSVMRAALARLAIASSITAIGIIYVVGLLASRPFMLKADQFLGIKAQHAIPLLIIAFLVFTGGAAEGEGWQEFRARVQSRLAGAMAEPARFGPLILGLIAVAVLLLIVARTGNDSGVGVSSMELKGRALLDRVLVTRPRTKEFLIGHPAFVLAWAWWLRGRRRPAQILFIVGSIGQVSLLNTFCHIHTPLVVSLWRDVLGLLIGAAVGAVAYRFLEITLPPPETGAPPTPGPATPAMAEGL